MTLAIVLAGTEASTGKHTWRQPSRTARAYFARIAAWGYPLSDVEQIVVGTDEVAPVPEAEDAADSDDVFPDEGDIGYHGHTAA